ncbi:armadillo-type protein [Limtongia smithiae]|uniref:armadillo-type protein n=1 Tax=Limtongia smithiae TaxID=1125753 RepID=UPI0034CDD119
MAAYTAASDFNVPVLPQPLDAARLQDLSSLDKQHIYVFSWLSDLHRFLESLDGAGASAHQIFVKNELAKLTPVSSAILSRPIRILVGKCYSEIFSKGDCKTLFDVINDLLTALNTGKADKNIESKFFLVHVIGDIFACAGFDIKSMAAHAILSLLRLIRYSNQNAGYRASIFEAMSQVFSLCGSFIDESMARDVSKQAKSAATGDKSVIVRAAALNCFREMFKTVNVLNNLSDLDSLRSIVTKAFDTPQACVRNSAALCWASALSVASTLTTSVVEVQQKRSKRPTPQPGADGEDANAPPPPPETVKKVVQNITLPFEDALKQLSSVYTKSGVSVRVRAGVIATYCEFFLIYGSGEVEARYFAIVQNLLDHLFSHPNITNNRFRKLSARRHVCFLLNEVVGQYLLGEQGRLNAVRILVNDLLKNYPTVMKDQYEPSKYTLVAAVSALKYLTETLGSAIIPQQTMVRDSLLMVLQHPNYTVQVATCSCIRSFLLQVPSQLIFMANAIMENLKRELGVLRSRRMKPEVAGRCTGYATGLAIVIGISSLRPQYASLDLTSRIFTMATALLKSSGNVDVLISTTQIHAAWTIISGLMSIGPSFVKLHLSQLLLLWKSALPKPLSKDMVADKNSLEYSFLLHVRECALSSILTFLQFNTRLVTSDVSKRLGVMLLNTSAFLNLITSRKIEEDPTLRLSQTLHLTDYQVMVRRRVFQCHIALISGHNSDGLQADVLTTAVSIFAEPENFTPPAPLSLSIAISAGTLDSIWEMTDNYACGVSSMMQAFNLLKFEFEKKQNPELISKDWLTTESFQSRIEQMLVEPVLGAVEHDYLSLFQQVETESGIVPWQTLPKSPQTAVVDYAIELFALLLPLQTDRIQRSILEQVASYMTASGMQRDLGRKAAVTANIAIALSATIKLVSAEKNNNHIQLHDEAVLSMISEILRAIVVKDDPYVRFLGADTVGRVCAIAGQNFMSKQVQYGVDEIFQNRDPHVRAGLALSFGSINRHVGGMATGSHLKTIAETLMSLSNDPHPVVHFWALKALASTMESTGLSFTSYSSKVTSMLCKLYLSDKHNQECSSALSSNLEAEYSTPRVIAHCLDALIGVLGPDLQEYTENRDLTSLLIQQMFLESDPLVVVEAIKCYQHSILFAPQYFDTQYLCLVLTRYINIPIKDLRDAAIDAYYQLARNNVNSLFKYAGRNLEGHLWLAMDLTPWHEGLRQIVQTWISQTGVNEARLWVMRCQAVMTKTIPRKKRETKVLSSINGGPDPDLGDEEVASFAASEDGNTGVKMSGSDDTVAGGEPLKWQTRIFALTCLREVLDMNKNTPNNLVPRIAEIVRLSFSASTSNVLNMRLVGVKLLDDILSIFGQLPDPEFADSTLLEQFQAQIASALTPAFASDSSPELAAEAVNVCGDFIASGIVKDVTRMGRILKLLTSALESCAAEGAEIVLGDLKSLSLNSQIMLKLAILTAWAELQIASVDKKFVLDVIEPQVNILAPLWLNALKDFAQLRFEPDTGNDMTSFSESTGAKDNVLECYEQSWLKIVEALSTLIEREPDLIISILDAGKSTLASGVEKNETNDDAAAFFFVIFGICFEGLLKAPGDDVLASRKDMPVILRSMKSIMRPAICGASMYDGNIFTESVDLFDRIILSESYECQGPLVDVLCSMCVNHPATKRQYDVDINGNDTMSEGTSQMFELLRGVMSVLTQMFPALGDQAESPKILTTEAVSLTKHAMDALKDMIEVFPFGIRLDLYAIYFHIFETFMDTPECQAAVIPVVLPSLRGTLANMIVSCKEADSEAYIQIIQEVRSLMALFTTTLERNSQTRSEYGIGLRKNCLLSLVVVVATCESILAANDPLIEDCCAVVIDSFNDPELVSVAAKCARSLLITSNRSSFSQILGRRLLPQLVALSSRDDMVGAPGSENDVAAMAVTVCDILIPFIKTLDGDRVAPAMAICIPIVLYAVKASQDEGSGDVSAQRRQLIDIANVDNLSFRTVISALSIAQRSQLDKVLKGAATGGNGVSGFGGTAGNGDVPSIQLRTDFAV